MEYDDVLSSVLSMVVIRTLSFLIAQFELKIVQFDVTTSFLDGFIDEELYLDPHEGLNISAGHTCKLIRSL